MDNMEIRFMTSDIETTDDGTMLVVGLVNRTESWSNELGQRRKFREKINKGAFSKALVDAPRVDFLMEHDSSKLLATTQNGSLKLYEDEEGLKMRAEIVPTTYGKDLYALMKSKIINHMSFGFKVIEDKWNKLADGTYRREVNSLKLFEVSAVRNPAYPQSLISARGLHLIENEDEIIPENLVEERNEQQVQNETTSNVVEEVVTQPIEQPVVEPQAQPTEQQINNGPAIEQSVSEAPVKQNNESGVTVEQFNQLLSIVTGLNEKIEKAFQPQVKQEVENNVQVEPVVEQKEEVKTPPDLSAFYNKIKQSKEIN